MTTRFNLAQRDQSRVAPYPGDAVNDGQQAPPTGFIPWRAEAMAFWLPVGVSAEHLGIAVVDPATLSTRSTKAQAHRT